MIFLKRSQIRRCVFSGEITVLLSLVFILMISMIGALIEGTNIQIAKYLKQAEMNLAMESVFAEYEKMMLERYGLLVRSGYEEQRIAERIEYYGGKNMHHRITKAELLTDRQGQEFYRQAVESMGGKGTADTALLEFSGTDAEEGVLGRLEELMTQQDSLLDLEGTPIEFVKRFFQTSLLTMVFPKQETLSRQTVKIENLPSHRLIEQGTGDLTESPNTSPVAKAMFVEYLMQHFQMFTQELKSQPFLYEAEYILAGNSSDQENLEEVIRKILNIRSVVNYGYLLTDVGKQAEAEALAVVIAAALPVPGSAAVIKQAILLAWAYGEGILDVRVLLEGGNIPFTKTTQSWQLQLANLESIMEAGLQGEGETTSRGNNYTEYIRWLLTMESREVLCERAMDIIELNTGLEMDQCVTALEMESTYEIRRGRKLVFRTSYQYK